MYVHVGGIQKTACGGADRRGRRGFSYFQAVRK